MKTADVVIIGGGVIGASTAYHLAARGCGTVRVVDGAGPGEGSTGKATGGFRCQFSTEVNVRLSLLSRGKLLSFRDELGVDPGYRPLGYLLLATGAGQMDALRKAQVVQKTCGLSEAAEVQPADIGRLNPAVAHEGLIGGVFCPSDGFISPLEILRGYREGAERLGVSFEYGTRCTGLVRRDAGGVAEVAEVRTSAGSIAPDVVVNAAGAWAGEVAAMAGCELPVMPLRRQVAVIRAGRLLPEAMPMTVFLDDGFHLRVRGEDVLLLLPVERPSYHSFDTGVEPDWLEAVKRRADKCVPALAQTSVDTAASWSGLYEMSPDKHAVLGRSPDVNNFFFVNGSSGHGVMHAPALGQLAAGIILEGEARVLDASSLRPARFREGRPNVSTEFL